MPISDQEFKDWLNEDSVIRCILIEAKYYDKTLAIEKTEYFSYQPYEKGSVIYDDCVKEIPSFNTSLDVPEPQNNNMNISASQSFGDIDLTNENGVRDLWLNHAWDGRDIVLKIGDPIWDEADFRVILNGVINDISAPDQNTIKLQIRGVDHLLDIQLQDTLLTTEKAKDKPVPICLGQVFNIEPVLIDAATHRYKVHEGQINDITDVRVNGLTVAGFTKDLVNGEFTLTVTPQGTITCDVQGAIYNAAYITKASDFVKYLIDLHSTINVVTGINTASFSQLDLDAPYQTGVYFDSRENLSNAINQILTSSGAFKVFDRDGLLSVYQFKTGGTPTLSILPDDVLEGKLSLDDRNTPVEEIRVGYQRNYHIQKDGLAASITESNRQLYGLDFQVEKDSDPTVSVAHLLAKKPNMIESDLVLSADALTESTRLLSLHKEIRFKYKLDGYVIPFQLVLGDTVTVFSDRYGLENGVDMVVIGIDESYTSKRVELTLWN